MIPQSIIWLGFFVLIPLLASVNIAIAMQFNKNLFPIILITYLLSHLAVAVRSQDHWEEPTLRMGIDFNFGATTTGSPFGYGLGINMLAKVVLSEQLTLVGSAGYGSLFTKDTSPIADYSYIPLKTMLKVFPVEENIYIAGTIGAGFGILKGSKTAFIFGGGLGYQWLTGYDLGLRYEGYQQPPSSTTYHPLNGQFALSFSYHF